MCKVSVVIPAYNSSAYIGDALQSIKAQSFHDWELIIIDDCSTDNTLSLCQELTKADSRIRVIEMDKNGGPSRARNKGIECAKGEYISFVDSDDTVDVDYLKVLVDTADRFRCDVVWCNYKEIKSGTSEIREHGLECNKVLDKKYALSLFFITQTGLSSLCNKLYRKEFITRYGLRINELRYHGEDWEFNLNIFKNGPKVVLVSAPLYNYNRINPSSVVSSFHDTDFDYFIKSNQMAEEIAREEEFMFDKKHYNGKLIYNSISLLRKLVHSNYIDKSKEWKRITQNEYLKGIITTGNYYQSLLPLRYKIYLFLIKNNLSSLVAWLMTHE